MDFTNVRASITSGRTWVLENGRTPLLMHFAPGVMLSADGKMDLKRMSSLKSRGEARELAELLVFVADLADEEFGPETA